MAGALRESSRRCARRAPTTSATPRPTGRPPCAPWRPKPTSCSSRAPRTRPTRCGSSSAPSGRGHPRTSSTARPTTSFDGMRDQLEHDLGAIDATSQIDVTLPATLLFEHAYRNQRVYRALCGRQGGALVQRYLRRLIGDLLRKHLRPQFTRAGTWCARRGCRRVLHLGGVGPAGVVDRPRILQRTGVVDRGIPKTGSTRRSTRQP